MKRLNYFVLLLLFTTLPSHGMDTAPINQLQFDTGFHSETNTRDYQEDRFAIYTNHGYLHVAIYDGHGGDEASSAAAEKLIPLFKKHHQKSNPIFAFQTAYEEFDADIIAKTDHGTTATNVYINSANKMLYAVNVGDSEAFLISVTANKKVVTEPLIEIHKPTQPHELNRLNEINALVSDDRVWTNLTLFRRGLMVSRALGDSEFKIPDNKGVIATPSVKTVQLKRKHKFVIAASDGLWDTVKADDAAAFIVESLNAKEDLTSVAKKLIDKAIKAGSSDNITVIIAELKWPGKRKRDHDDKQLKTARFYISETNANVWGKKLKTANFPNWFDHKLISKELFPDGGEHYLDLALKHHGNFLWAPEFANSHNHFYFLQMPIVVDSETYFGPEQYFQSQKARLAKDAKEIKTSIQKARDPELARELGRTLSIDKDKWMLISTDVMKRALLAKFSQDETLEKLLLSTGAHQLVYVAPNNYIWGTGKNGDGKNLLGECLMWTREILQLGASNKTAITKADAGLKTNIEKVINNN